MASIVLRGQLNRTTYQPGDTVKCLFSVLAAPSASIGAEEAGRWEGPTQGLIPLSSVSDGDGPCAELTSLRIQLIGSCSIDPSRIDEGVFRGEAEAQSAASSDANTSTGDNEGESFPANGSFPSSATDSPSSAATGSDSSSYDFFQSDVVDADLTGSSVLLLHQRARGGFSCQLPQNLPPLHKGHSVRYSYWVYICCCWEHAAEVPAATPMGVSASLLSTLRNASPAAASLGRKVTTLKVPVKVQSPVAALRVLRAPFAPLFRGADGRGAKIILARSQSSPAVAPPLATELLTRDSTIGSSAVCDPSRHYIAQVVRSGVERLSTPTHFLVRVRQAPVLTTFLLTPAVSLGDTLRGCFIAEPGSEYTCLRVTATTHLYELVPRRLFHRKAVVPNKTEVPPAAVAGLLSNTATAGVDMVVTHGKVVDEVDWFVAQAVEMPFTIPISGTKYNPTFHTETVSLTWSLQLTFHCCKTTEWASMQRSGKSKTIAVSSEDMRPSLTIPIVVFPPLATPEAAGDESLHHLGPPVYSGTANLQ